MSAHDELLAHLAVGEATQDLLSRARDEPTDPEERARRAREERERVRAAQQSAGLVAPRKESDG